MRKVTYVNDRYGFDVLANDPHRRNRPVARDVPAAMGLLLEDVESGFVGEITGIEDAGGETLVALTDRNARTRMFPLGPGYWIDGQPVRLVAPVVQTPQASSRTASGSRHIAHRARVAKASRIWVEGRHDAELVEKVWGDDLRYEGIVVEYLEGIDNLAERLLEFDPGPQRRVGVLVDHLVEHSKESRIASQIHSRFDGVLVLGHPYIDVWQAVKPARLGLAQWPHVPYGTDIKIGTLRALGWAHSNQTDIARAWQKILGQVRDFRDLEPSLLGRVEELVDFVTAPGAH